MDVEQGESVPASVLLPFVGRDDGVRVLLTRRTDHLRDHPGQIAFPGGRVEPSDQSAEMTALRETHEEIGIGLDRIEVLGRLPVHVTGTGFRITPVVGVVHPPFQLALDEFEVAEVFEVPLEHFLDPANHQQHSIHYRGRLRHYHAMPFGHYYIWGATAGILYSLYRFIGRA